jgi:hypothetical protein
MHSIDWRPVGRLGSLHGFALRAFKNELGVQAPVGCWDVGRLVSLHGFALRAFKNELGVQVGSDGVHHIATQDATGEFGS